MTYSIVQNRTQIFHYLICMNILSVSGQYSFKFWLRIILIIIFVLLKNGDSFMLEDP